MHPGALAHFATNHLVCPDGVFRIDPHMLFIHLRKAVDVLIADLRASPAGADAAGVIANAELLPD